MRRRTGAKMRSDAIKAVLALLVVLALAVSGLFVYLWHDNVRDGSLAALAIVPTVALAFAAALAYQQNARLINWRLARLEIVPSVAGAEGLDLHFGPMLPSGPA